MTILGNRSSLLEDEVFGTEEFTVPAVFKQDEKEMSLKKSIVLSAILHPVVIGIVGIILLILILLGVNFALFNPPKPKINDLTFVLVDNVKQQMPIDRNTALRSAKNTRKGGNYSKKREIYMPSPSPGKKSPKQSMKNNSKKHSLLPKNIFKSLMQPMRAPQARPHPPSLRPSVKPPSLPRPKTAKSAFTITIPKSDATSSSHSYSTGSAGGHGTATSGGSSSGTGRSHGPAASFSPTDGGGSSAGSKLSGSGSGYSGNPGGGGGASGLDSIQNYDMSPYIKYVEKKINMNWDPPKGTEDKTAVVLLKIGRDGRLISNSIFKSSGLPNFDKQMLNAVELASPFRTFPIGYKHQDLDITFYFHYNLVKN